MDETPPLDFDALKAAILDRKASLPRRMMQVAVFALDRPDDIAFGTAASVAEASGVQPSTLVRFAQTFGYDGFSSLQHIFQARLRKPTYSDRLEVLGGESQLLSGFLSAAEQSVRDARSNIREDAFERAVTLLAGADTIWLVAKRRSFPISSYMAYAFGKMKIRYQLVGSALGVEDDLLALARPTDAGFAVSFSPYASESVQQARKLHDAGVPVVALTDSAFSPLAEYSREWFEIAEADFGGFRSLSASIAFAMALTVAIAEKRR